MIEVGVERDLVVDIRGSPLRAGVARVTGPAPRLRRRGQYDRSIRMVDAAAPRFCAWNSGPNHLSRGLARTVPDIPRRGIERSVIGGPYRHLPASAVAPSVERHVPSHQMVPRQAVTHETALRKGCAKAKFGEGPWHF